MIEAQETITTNDLIADLADLNERLVDLYESAMSAEDKEVRLTLGRSFERLAHKRHNMLIQLRDAINDEIGAEK